MIATLHHNREKGQRCGGDDSRMPESHQNPNHTRSLPNYLGQNIHLKARPITPTLKSALSLSNAPSQKRLVRSPGQMPRLKNAS